MPSPLSDTSSDACVRWIKERLTHCTRNHQVCNPSLGDDNHARRQLPKRLIDITQHPTVRLLETTTQHLKYACLSHCWGRSMALTTTTSTLARRTEGIEWQHLPRTFQHTITLVLNLGLSYLWIDSLCILQDSDEDWTEHSGQMASIYSNAYITIAATRAPDGSHGLFSTGESAMTWHGIPLLFRERPTHPSFNETSLRDFPLLQRAWVAQEILLSKRVIQFCEGFLVFECMEDCHCTCDNEKEYDHGHLKDPVWSSGWYGAIADAQSHPERGPEHFDRWLWAVMFYTKLSLTFKKDRLPAISGLARRFAEKYRCSYFGGKWYTL